MFAAFPGEIKFSFSHCHFSGWDNRLLQTSCKNLGVFQPDEDFWASQQTANSRRLFWVVVRGAAGEWCLHSFLRRKDHPLKPPCSLLCNIKVLLYHDFSKSWCANGSTRSTANTTPTVLGKSHCAGLGLQACQNYLIVRYHPIPIVPLLSVYFLLFPELLKLFVSQQL